MKAEKSELDARLASIEGHIKGIRKMVDDDQYCVDILKQTYAVRRAIDKLEAVLMQGHLNGCVRDGFHHGRDDEMVGELTELFELSRR